MEIVAILSIGLVIGFISAFFGIGGGIVAIPGLLFVFDGMDAHYALGTSLFMTLLNASRNSYFFLTKKGLRGRLNIIGWLVLFVVIGSVIGGQIALYVSSKLVTTFLAVYLLATSVKLFLMKKQHHTTEEFDKLTKIPARSAAAGFTAGIVSVLTGVGGGGVLIPFFINLFKMPLRIVPAYSNYTMVFTSLAGIGTYLLANAKTNGTPLPFTEYQVGYVNIPIAVLFFLGTFPTYKLGAYCSHKFSPKTTKRLFALLLVLVGIKLLFR